MDVLCSDKTGTLTQNKLALNDPFVHRGRWARRSRPCSRAGIARRSLGRNRPGGDHRTQEQEALKSYQVLHFQPFDPVGKRTEATLKGAEGGQFKTSKGAPQVILKLVSNAPQVQSQVEKAVNEFARRGFRSLGVARTDAHGQWQFLGVLPLSDPPREDSKTTIATAAQMGVRVKMVTGDQVAIAKEIAAQVELGTNILDAALFSKRVFRRRLSSRIRLSKPMALHRSFPSTNTT